MAVIAYRAEGLKTMFYAVYSPHMGPRMGFAPDECI
jgi:hypothetical protein